MSDEWGMFSGGKEPDSGTQLRQAAEERKRREEEKRHPGIDADHVAAGLIRNAPDIMSPVGPALGGYNAMTREASVPVGQALRPEVSPYMKRASQMLSDSPVPDMARGAIRGVNPIQQAKSLTGPTGQALAAIGNAALPTNGLAGQFGGAVAPTLLSKAAEYMRGKPVPNEAIQRNPIENTMVGQGMTSPMNNGSGQPGNDLMSRAQSLMSQEPPKPVHVGAQNVDLVDPKLQAQQADAYDQQEGAVDNQIDAAIQQGDAHADKALAEAGAKTVTGQARANAAEGIERGAQERDTKLAELRQGIDATSKAVAMQSKENPDRWWDNQSTGKKIGWGIATALSGFGAGMLGQQKNPVIDMIHEHVENDIAAQRKNYEHSRDRLADQNSLYAQAYRATGDHELATHLAIDMGLGAVQDQVDATVASKGSPIAMANGQMVKAKLQEKRGEIQEEKIGAAIKNHKYVPAHTITPGGGAGMGANYGKNSDAEHIADRRQREMLPRLQEIQRKKDEIIARNGGHIPGSGLIARTAYNMLPEQLVNAAAGDDAALYRGLEMEQAEAQNKLSGQRGLDVLNKTVGVIRGSGSEKYRRDMDAHFGDVDQATEQNMYNGYPIEESRNVRTTRPMQPTDFQHSGLANVKRRREEETPEGFEE